MKILIQWVVAEILHFNKLPGQVSAAPSKNHTLSSLELRDVWPSFISNSKESAYNAGDPGLIPGLGRSSGERNGNPL